MGDKVGRDGIMPLWYQRVPRFGVSDAIRFCRG